MLIGSGGVALLIQVATYPLTDLDIRESFTGARHISLSSGALPADLSRCDTLYIELRRSAPVRFTAALSGEEGFAFRLSESFLDEGKSVVPLALNSPNGSSDRNELRRITGVKFGCFSEGGEPVDCSLESLSAAAAGWRSLPYRIITGMGLVLFTLLTVLIGNFRKGKK